MIENKIEKDNELINNKIENNHEINKNEITTNEKIIINNDLNIKKGNINIFEDDYLYEERENPSGDEEEKEEEKEEDYLKNFDNLENKNVINNTHNALDNYCINIDTEIQKKKTDIKRNEEFHNSNTF